MTLFNLTQEIFIQTAPGHTLLTDRFKGRVLNYNSSDQRKVIEIQCVWDTNRFESLATFPHVTIKMDIIASEQEVRL